MRLYNRDTGETYEVEEEYYGGVTFFDRIVLFIDMIKSIVIAIFVGLAAIAVIATLVIILLAEVGILKSTVTVSINLEDNRGVNLENVQVIFTSMNEKDGEYKEYSATFDPDTDTSKVKVPKGEYVLYCEYDGEKYSLDMLETTGLKTYERQFTDENFLVMRAAQIVFRNKNGEILYPEQLSIIDSDGDEQTVYLLDNGKYVVYLYNDCGEVSWTINADKYETKEITFDGASARVLDIEVTLNEI